MKKFAILFAIIALAMNVAVAENVKPTAVAKVKVEHNGYNLINVSVKNSAHALCRIKLYDNDFSLLHSETISEAGVKSFDISKLEKGHYLLKVVAGGETVYAEAIEKIK